MSSSFSIMFTRGRTLFKATKVVIILWFLISSAKHPEAARIFPEKKLTDGVNKVLFPQDHVPVPQLHVQNYGSTPRYHVPVPPSAPNGCTYIPGPGKDVATSEENGSYTCRLLVSSGNCTRVFKYLCR